jgi:rhizosphere induced protein
MPTSTTPAEATVSYSLVFVNQTGRSADVCLFQTGPDSGEPPLAPLAWLARKTYPPATVVFRWSRDYQLVWGDGGALVPGSIFLPSELWQANIATGTGVILRYADGMYWFEPDPAKPLPGNLTVKVASVGHEPAAIGIGMNGHTTMVTMAEPNTLTTFGAPHTYSIAFGDFTEGEVLDPNAIPNAYLLTYPSGVFSMTAILEADGTWLVRPTSVVNARHAAARAADPSARWGAR